MEEEHQEEPVNIFMTREGYLVSSEGNLVTIAEDQSLCLEETVTEVEVSLLY